MTVRVSTEGPRGCGNRKVGGTYLVCGPGSSRCGRMPILLEVYPVCSRGIKPSRGYSWVQPEELLGGVAECKYKTDITVSCNACPVGGKTPEKAMLIWVGKKFYNSTETFLNEASVMGVSRRIRAVPKGFILGETIVLLAHREAVPTLEPSGVVMRPGVFATFKPNRIECVVDEETTDEGLAKLEARGISPVIVQKLETIDLF